jgi:hypothetical protein
VGVKASGSAASFLVYPEMVSTPSAQEIGAMHNIMIRTLLGAFALLLSVGVFAKPTINYSADQAASCPPATGSQEDEDTADNDATAPAPAPARAGSTPIKSGKSTRPKWKALLPGAIK